MKLRKSKLDPFAAKLAEMDLQKTTLAAMLAWLKHKGVTCSSSTLSEFLAAQRKARSRWEMLAGIASGSKRCKEVDLAFKKNPAPALDTLIKLFKLIILNLTTDSGKDPEMLRLADQLSRTALDFTSGQTKAAQKARQLALEERKQAESRKDEQTKALELCLEEANEFAEVKELFKTAFAALKAAQERPA